MAKRKSMKNDFCPVARAVDIVGDRWSLLIIREAFSGICRFSEFQKNLGIARNILTNRLYSLEKEKIFQLSPASDGSTYQEYVLTPKGKDLFIVIVSLRQWAEQYLFEKNESHSYLIEQLNGKSVQKIQLFSHQGKLLKPEDTSVSERLQKIEK